MSYVHSYTIYAVALCIIVCNVRTCSCITLLIIHVSTYNTTLATCGSTSHFPCVQFLSRAFRNRFIELHFEEIPPSELITILHSQSGVPESYAKKMVAVMQDLQVCGPSLPLGDCTIVPFISCLNIYNSARQVQLSH